MSKASLNGIVKNGTVVFVKAPHFRKQEKKMTEILAWKQVNFLTLKSKVLFNMNEPLDQIREIRSIMERSSKFLSLSGLSGVFAGVCALCGAWHFYSSTPVGLNSPYPPEVVRVFIQDGVLILTGALFSGIFFTARKARSNGQSIWGVTSRTLLSSMLIPLITGGIFCLGLVYYQLHWLCFAASLIFYGLALVSGSKYTVSDPYYLGLMQVALGLAAFFFPERGLLLWAVGFGGLHIIYGVAMYIKYDRN